MTLFHERHGAGSPVVLVHGWGLHGGVWSELAAALAANHEVIVPDLPGHGRSRAMPMPAQLDGLADVLAALVNAPAAWLGWSLGGMATLALARRHPGKVTRLVLVDSTPRFVQSADWPHAMSEPVFRQFAANLAKDYRATLMRFLSLHAGRDEASRTLIKRLRTELVAQAEPDPQALAGGLAILEHSDLRAQLAAIPIPALVMHGRLDRLAPPAAGDYLAAHLPNACQVVMEHAAHAPFLSDPGQFLEAVAGFLA